jgi:hypothetical protein
MLSLADRTSGTIPHKFFLITGILPVPQDIKSVVEQAGNPVAKQRCCVKT